VFKSFENLLYPYVYINIIENLQETVVYIEELYFSGSVDNYEEVFNTTKKEDIYEYIQSFAKKSPFYYISLLDNSPSYGASSISFKGEGNLYYDSKHFENICIPDKWIYFTSKSDLLELKNSYSKVGLDFIFSPFAILANFFNDKIKKNIAMYILINKDDLNISIFENSKLFFASHLYTNNKGTDADNELIDIDDNKELELDDTIDVDLDDINIELMDEFADIEDLDTFDDMDEFSQDIEEENLDTKELQKDILEGQSNFSVDYYRFSLIQNAVNDFYKNNKFDSKFIEMVYIADTVGITNDLKKFLEEEMFLNVYVRKMDLGSELCELSKVESK